MDDSREDPDGPVHWITPDAAGAEFVPDASGVERIVDSLLAAGWIRSAPRGAYEVDPTFYYAPYPGCIDAAEVETGDALFSANEGVIRRSHCKAITVMVTDALLVAPTAKAHASMPRCSACGGDLLPVAEAGKSRLVPSECPRVELL